MLLYNGNRRVPDWVLEVLTLDRFQGEAKRTDSFQEDPDLPPGEAAKLEDYEDTGYNRGHMAPAEDMKWDQKAIDESFYLSNMGPQLGIGLNPNTWRELEQYVRALTKDREPLVVITGPIWGGLSRRWSPATASAKTLARTTRVIRPAPP